MALEAPWLAAAAAAAAVVAAAAVAVAAVVVVAALVAAAAMDHRHLQCSLQLLRGRAFPGSLLLLRYPLLQPLRPLLPLLLLGEAAVVGATLLPGPLAAVARPQAGAP